MHKVPNIVSIENGSVIKMGPNVDWEYEVYQSLYKLGWKYAPKVTKRDGALSIELVGDSTLEDYIPSDLYDRLLERCITILHSLHELEWVHGDPNVGNWRIDSQTGRIWLIDYETSYHRSHPLLSLCPKDDMDILMG